MSKLIACIILVITLFGLTPTGSRAKESDASASIKTVAKPSNSDYRVDNLSKFLTSYNSPLAPYSREFVTFADKYDLDYRLVPAIAGVESTFGKQIPYNSFNAYGWANGDYSFQSWQDSIEIVSGTLRKNYIDKGATTVAQIARIYAPPSSTWAGKVSYFLNKIDPLPVSFDI